jgi:GTPase SAR1 family protein
MALGFAFETMLSVLTAKFLPLFLIVWIILNISESNDPVMGVRPLNVLANTLCPLSASSFQPLTVMGPFYNFFLIFPFYHHVEASKIIFFNTSPSSYLGVHFGALFGVIGVNWIFLALAVWLERKRDDKAAKQEQEKKQDEEKKQEEEQ